MVNFWGGTIDKVVVADKKQTKADKNENPFDSSVERVNLFHGGFVKDTPSHTNDFEFL